MLGVLECEWPAYRLVVEGWCTLGELESLSLDDVLDACDVLDAVAEARRDEA